ncbi:MAG: DUF2851 family protein [Alphaproteobacteria bacterium]|nr:DUF2851 family protein [Alphaproteobacteria bacterium]
MASFQENFLHLVWKYQYYDKKQAVTTDDIPIEVIKIGYHNNHEGPDFKEAKVRIGDTEYHGHVEIHLKSSDWNAHNHQSDPAYNTVILHVVWEHDYTIRRKDGTEIPTLELKGKVLLEVVRNYERLINSQTQILCGNDLAKTADILKFSMLEKTLVERLHEKSKLILTLLNENNQDWEETAYQWLFYSLGFKTNNQVMLKLAKSLPYRLLKKHGNQQSAQEAMLLGQAGFLDHLSEGLFEPAASEPYTAGILREYLFLKKKYGLKPQIYASEWKFMGVRPANYPTIRLAQAAALLARSPNFFSSVLYDTHTRAAFIAVFDVEVSPYWRHHYHLGKPSERPSTRKLSPEILDLLAINYVVPLWYAYGTFIDSLAWQEKCFDFLQQIPPESNHIIKKFAAVNWNPLQGFESQAMIGLFNNYCKPRKCLTCKIGQNLLRPSTG